MDEIDICNLVISYVDTLEELSPELEDAYAAADDVLSIYNEPITQFNVDSLPDKADRASQEFWDSMQLITNEDELFSLRLAGVPEEYFAN